MKADNRPFIVGITGGIASGKSVATRYFMDKGYEVYSADQITHDLYEDKELILQLIKIVNSQYPNGISSPERQCIARSVFADKELLTLWNQLFHPLILRELQNKSEECKKAVLLFEVPLLFEAQLERCFDLVITIICSEKTRLCRLEERGLSIDDAMHRIKAQTSDVERSSKTDLIIYNDGDLRELFEKLAVFEQLMPRLKKRDIIPFTYNEDINS